MGKKKETFVFLGKSYPMVAQVQPGQRTHGGDRRTPISISNTCGTFMAQTTCWFDDNVVSFADDNANGDTPQAAIRNLDRQCIRQFKRMAKACGYTVTG